jgi:lipopolysaccharide transport system ATP-binding protein
VKTNDVLISVEGISKKFCRNLKRSLWYGIKDLANELLCRNPGKELREEEFWALRDISFELRRGEILGIIGANGSGKTTLLRLINGLIKPDKGKITITGRIGALIALGAGFNPILTGRENIYINAAVLGLKKKEIDAAFDDIVGFAEIGDFIDSPVKFYSSGMYVRLGFSIAVHCDPEILLVDEILSVGDVAFRQKSMKKMLDIIKSGTTICFVSHNLQAVEQVCHKALWLHHGEPVILDKGGFVLEKYKMFQNEKATESLAGGEAFNSGYSETGLIWVPKCEIIDENAVPKTKLSFQDRFILRIHYATKEPVEHPYFMVHINNWENHCLFQANMLADGGEPEVLENHGWLDIDFGNPPFLPGSYLVKVQIRRDAHTEHFYSRTLATFRVVASPADYGYSGRFKHLYTSHTGIAQPYHYSWGDNQISHGSTVQ